VLALRSSARSVGRRLAPGYAANRARRYEREVRASGGVTAAAERLLAGQEPTVQAGPFAGMKYPPDRIADIDASATKLLGTYELEIAWVFERALKSNVTTFLDIGCADGYYAVGMAYASPTITTYAYDLASSARELCAATAVASGAEGRVRIAKCFRRETLANLAVEEALVLCDIEGGEVELLDSRVAAALRCCVVVVEVHESQRRGAGARLREVFATTHDVITVAQRPRVDIPGPLESWSAAERTVALSEFRDPDLHWLVFEPRSAGKRG
jgi:predicted RNA methylase